MDTERSVVLPSAPVRGLTLIELLVALAVLAVLLAAGVPAFSALAAGNRAAAAVNAVATDLAYARGEAVRRNRNVVLCPSADGAACDASGWRWDGGWIVFADLDRDRERGPGEPLLRRGQGAGRVRVATSPGRRRIVFRPFGTSGGSNASFTFCPEGPAAPRVLCLSNTGRVRLSATRCDGSPVVCP